MADRKKYVGLAAIDKGIRAFEKIAGNVNDRVSDLAVSIIEHGAGAGNGDMSRALYLCQAVKRHRTLNVAFLIGYFRYFGNCNVNLNADNGKGKVSLVSKDSKSYRGFDPAGAREHNWFDAYDADGNKAPWYSGPPPAQFTPGSIGDVAAYLHGVTKTLNDRLTKEVEKPGYKGPAIVLPEGDLQQVRNAMAFIDRIANTLARHEEAEQAAKAMAEAMEAAEADEVVVSIMTKPVEEPKAEQAEGEQPQEQAVA